MLTLTLKLFGFISKTYLGLNYFFKKILLIIITKAKRKQYVILFFTNLWHSIITKNLFNYLLTKLFLRKILNRKTKIKISISH